jgi:predicted acylesterase/phospholipase RssA
MYKNIILSAGALSSFVHFGVYRYFYENNLLNNIENIIGTSGGSIASLIFILKPSYLDIKKIIYLILKYGNLKKCINIDISNIFNLINNFGIIEPKFLYIIINIILKYHNINNDITFNQFYQRFPINLMITGSNLTKSKPEIFSYKNTPNMKLITAITISCAIPVLFKPIKYNGNYYVDGAVFNYFPYDILINENTIKKNPNIINETFAVSIILHDLNINNLFKYILYLNFLVSNNNIYNNNYYNHYNNIFYYYEKLSLFDFLNMDLQLYYKFINIIDSAYNKFTNNNKFI